MIDKKQFPAVVYVLVEKGWFKPDNARMKFFLFGLYSIDHSKIKHFWNQSKTLGQQQMSPLELL